MQASACLHRLPPPAELQHWTARCSALFRGATMQPVQLRLPWTPPPPTARVIEAGGRSFPVQVVRHHGARRYILRVTTDGIVRVTVPRRGSVAGALSFAAGQTGWIIDQWERRRAGAEWLPGTRVWYRGQQHEIVRTPTTIICGPAVLPCPAAEPGQGFVIRDMLHRAWRTEAAGDLPGRCLALGVPFGLRPARVQVRNQQSRWGSCSSRGTIALNWRLIQMPDEVADYVMLHELVHLEHPNHSVRFWRRVAATCPGWRAAERWLRTHGRDLL